MIREKHPEGHPRTAPTLAGARSAKAGLLKIDSSGKFG